MSVTKKLVKTKIPKVISCDWLIDGVYEGYTTDQLEAGVYFGAEDVRNLVKNKFCGVVWVTRYSTVLNTIGCMVEEGIISNHEVLILLNQKDEDSFTEFYFNSDGYIDGDWPYGILD